MAVNDRITVGELEARSIDDFTCTEVVGIDVTLCDTILDTYGVSGSSRRENIKNGYCPSKTILISHTKWS